MTLGNMRQNGVRRLLLYCYKCHHEAVLDVESYDENLPVKSFERRLRCTSCGTRGADARPNWKDLPPRIPVLGLRSRERLPPAPAN